MFSIRHRAVLYWGPSLVFCLVFAATVAAQWLVYVRWFRVAGGIRLLTPAAAGAIGALLTYECCRHYLQKVERLNRRAAVIADVNHHIRNALNTICCAGYMQYGERNEVLRWAVVQIEWALAEVLTDIDAEGERAFKQPPKTAHFSALEANERTSR